eukprot:4642305-Amphidinium_carterae.1
MLPGPALTLRTKSLTSGDWWVPNFGYGPTVSPGFGYRLRFLKKILKWAPLESGSSSAMS